MRKSILAPIAIVICLSVQAQDYKADVKTQFSEYMKMVVEKNFAKSMDYVNPALFKIIPKEQFTKAMEAAFNNPELEIGIEKVEIVSIGDKQTISGVNYVKLKYISRAKLRFNKAAGSELDTASVRLGLEQTYGKGNVAYDAKTKYWTMKKTEEAIANSGDNKKWTFLVLAENQKPLLQKILPKEVL